MEFEIGDKVWLIDMYGQFTDGEGIAVFGDTITDIYVDEDDPDDEPLYQTTCATFWDSSIGDLAFKTKEGADVKLKDLEEYSND